MSMKKDPYPFHAHRLDENESMILLAIARWCISICVGICYSTLEHPVHIEHFYVQCVCVVYSFVPEEWQQRAINCAQGYGTIFYKRKFYTFSKSFYEYLSFCVYIWTTHDLLFFSDNKIFELQNRHKADASHLLNSDKKIVVFWFKGIFLGSF